MSSLDLSKFKKVAEDAKTSVLKHQDGHELKIAHSALSSKMKAELKKLPLYQAEGTEPLDDTSPEAAADSSRPGDDSAVPSDDDSDRMTPAQVQAVDNSASPPALADDSGVPSDDASDSMTAAQVQREDYPKPAVIPSAGEVTVTAPPKHYVPTVQELDNENELTAQDMARGHIQPKTFADLWAKKDTPQKIMTVIGLMLSGAGSGLAHQKNAALEIIQNEINNDLAAQQNSNSNAQNWLKLSHDYHMQKAQIAETMARTGLAGEQTKLTTQQAAESKARAALTAAQIKALVPVTARNNMTLGLLQHALSETDSLPPAAQGPAKDLINNVLIPEARAKMHEDNVNGVAKQTLLNSMLPPPPAAKPQAQAAPAPPPAPAVDMKKLNNLIQIGKIEPMAGISPAEAGQASMEVGRVEKNRGLYRSWLDSFRQLQGEFAAGQFNEERRAALVNVLTAQIARSTTKSYNASEAHATADAMYPTYKDRFGSADTKIQKGSEFFKNEESDTPTLNRFGLKTPFPGPYEGVTFKDKKTGKRKRMVNGKLVDVP